MSKPDFISMSRPQFRQYIFEHREDDEALSIYLERFQSPNSIRHPAPKSLEDLDNFPELHRKHLEQRENQA
ncbi:MAG: hypothetical protein KME54_07245 [Tolypothrix brevis GSE-NOS-MK-07-07A]|jgi:hypothetical protein|nr:hypothetical protein [Tolypothrix brevis GSE-NOS-MK-07-07A]